MKQIFMIAGSQGAGKDYTAKRLAHYLYKKTGKEAHIFRLADPIKDILAKTFNITLKEVERLKRSNEKVCFNLTMRELLQRFGTEACQCVFGRDVWIKMAQNVINNTNCDTFIIPDFRFKLDYELLKDSGDVTTILVKKYPLQWRQNPFINSDSHRSEHDLADFEFDLIWYNDFNRKGYNKTVKKFVKELVNKPVKVDFGPNLFGLCAPD